MKIGILALQGAFQEHVPHLERLGAEPVFVRLPQDLPGLSGLILPGGESTVMGKLAEKYELMEPLREFAGKRAVWGICAGMILLAENVDRDQPGLEVLDIEVTRNAYGSQRNSFIREVCLGAPGEPPFPGVFIRAPRIESVGSGVTPVALLPDETVVGVCRDRVMATAFHPELTEDDRMHRRFLDMAAGGDA
ncbi:MAG TPA: pyridoxal 5'-phosphate synthase glutaminase subunit PdxT [Desulfomicrobiaceae bacterium]|nr:pyridoxal 5'-phosphate synthase glutaminase subunit PdxT [Desulfomicrobiaceae bacterium]